MELDGRKSGLSARHLEVTNCDLRLIGIRIVRSHPIVFA
jgi:hypothetical protein